MAHIQVRYVHQRAKRLQTRQLIVRKVQLAKRREHAHVGGELADRFFLQVQSFHLFWRGAKRHKVQQRFKAKGGHFSQQLEREGEKDVRVLLCELHEQFYDLSFLLQQN